VAVDRVDEGDAARRPADTPPATTADAPAKATALREFAAVFLRYRVVNLGICAVLVIVPVAVAAMRYVASI